MFLYNLESTLAVIGLFEELFKYAGLNLNKKKKKKQKLIVYQIILLESNGKFAILRLWVFVSQ